MNFLSPVSALIAGSGFLMFAGGINSILLPLLGSQKDFTAINLGLIGAAWAIGYVSGCLLVPHIVQRVGHIRSFSVLAALAAITILACLENEPRFPGGSSAAGWIIGGTATHSLSSHNRPHSGVRKSDTMIDWPSPLGRGGAFSPLRAQHVLQMSF